MRTTATQPLILALLIAVSSRACTSSEDSVSPDAGAGADAQLDASAMDARADVALEVDGTAPCDNGCILASKSIGTFSREEIAAAVPPTVVVENGYAIYWLTFVTNGRTANATVTIPAGAVQPPAGGWAIAVNNPGTVGVADKCAVAFTLTGSGLSGYFGARGYIGVTIDYPGLGTGGFHPYLDGEVDGRASLDAIRATQELLADLGTVYSGKAVVAGLSQGGHATLFAASEQPTYAPELNVVGYAVVGPASVFLEHWQPGLGFDGSHLVYHALLSHSWSQVYIGPSPFVDGTIAPLIDDHCFFATNTPELESVLSQKPAEIFSAKFLTEFSTGTFTAFGFMQTGFSKNRMRAFDQAAPIRIYQGDADVVVTEPATAELVAELQKGNAKIEYIVVPGGGHTDIAFSYLASPQSHTDEAIAWFDSLTSP